MDIISVPSIEIPPVEIRFKDVDINTHVYRRQNKNVTDISVDSNSLKVIFKKIESGFSTMDSFYKSTLEIDVVYDEKNKKWIVTQSQS